MTNLFLMPGETLIYMLLSHAPWAASFLGIGTDPIVLRIVLSALCWILACFGAWALYRLTLRSVRLVNAVFLTGKFRMVQGLGSAKTMLTCRLRRWLPKTGRASITTHSDVQFDKIDLAVLRTAAAQDQARTMSAPELAKRFGMRPAQFQGSLQKLHNSKMLDKAVPSTKGFDSYRLTNYGAAYISMYRRQHAAAG